MNDRSWVEISLKKLKKNIQILAEQLLLSQQIMAVVKADAYGHGDVEVASILQDVGVENFAVSNVDEAIRLREAGIKGQILILGYTAIKRAKELYDYDITQALISEEYAEGLANTSFPIKCQFAIDTGMNRIGLPSYAIATCEQIIRKYYNSNLILTGVFTHLCVADTIDGNEFTGEQISAFKKVIEKVRDLNLPFYHFLNSAGGIWHTDEASILVRFGIVMYGLKPDYSNTLPKGIKPILSWKSVISMVKDIRPGDTVGYGRSFKADRNTRIATIPTGYADGYPRELSNKGYVLINGKKAQIIGRICMDQMMVDVTGIPNVNMGTEVVLVGREGGEVITADDIAHMSGTIGYEIVCGISKRVPRIYQTM